MLRSSRDRRLMSVDGNENGVGGRSNNNNNNNINNISSSSSSSSHNGSGSSNFVTRSWARISGRRKKQRPPPIEEGIEPLEDPLPSTSNNQQIPWRLANHEENRPKPFLNRGMDKLRRSIRKSFRKAPSLGGSDSSAAAATSSNGIVIDGSSSSSPWEADGKNVRAGICKFNVKYLGSCEVYESRGVHVCEGALQHLKSRKRPTKAILYISGDGLRVVDRESNRGLIVDQTIEKVSFCAPDRHCDKGFAYICREGASRRWMCHGFLTTKESGERVSHAVGCAFTVCLEGKKKREAEQTGASGTTTPATTAGATSSVTVKTQPTTKYSDLNAVWNTPPPTTSTSGTSNPSSFAQNNPAYASFRRQLSITERKQDPQTAIVNDPILSSSASVNTKAVINESTVTPRPVANLSLFDRQGSFKGPTVSQQAFKRFNSLRSDLLSRPNLDSTRLLNTEPIYEGDEFWPDTSLSSHSIVNTLPVSTSLQFNHIAENNKENGTESPMWNGIFNPTCQSTPTHSVRQPPLLAESQAPALTGGSSKADEWLEQTFKSLSFQNDSSKAQMSQSQSVDFLAPLDFPSGPLSSQPLPPPLPVSRPVCEQQIPNPVTSIAPAIPSSQPSQNMPPLDAPDSINTHVRKGSAARKSIEYQLLEEENAPVSPPRNTPIAVDAFGLPVFVPPPPPINTTATTTTTTTAAVMTTRNGPSLSDPFDIQWSTAVLKSTSANGHHQPSVVSNPFTSESEAVNV